MVAAMYALDFEQNFVEEIGGRSVAFQMNEGDSGEKTYCAYPLNDDAELMTTGTPEELVDAWLSGNEENLSDDLRDDETDEYDDFADYEDYDEYDDFADYEDCDEDDVEWNQEEY